MPGADLVEQRVVEHGTPGDRRPRLDEYAVLVAGRAGGLVAEVGVHLDLVDRRQHPGLLDDPVEVRRLEVRDPDAPGPSVGRELAEGVPRRHEVAVVQHRHRPVDQEQVDTVDAQVGQRLVERTPRVVGSVEGVAQLAREVELLARDPAGGDRLADALLVAVHLRGVDVPVAHLDRLPGDLRRPVRRHLEHPHSELGDRRAVVESQVGDRHAPTLTLTAKTSTSRSGTAGG